MTKNKKITLQHRRQAERRCRKSGLDSDKIAYVHLKISVDRLVDIVKEAYYKEKFMSITSCKELFSTTNFLFGLNNDTCLPDGTERELCVRFALFFSDKIIQMLDSQCVQSAKFEKTSCITFATFREVTEEEVAKCIKSSASKSCALDPIPTSLLKLSIDVLLSHITLLINDSFKNGSLAPSLKQAIA